MKTTVLLPKELMLERFRKIVGDRIIQQEKDFYSALLSLSQKEVSERKLVFKFTLALGLLKDKLVVVNITKHLDAMVSDEGKVVAEEAKKVFENIARRSGRMN